MSKQVDDRVVSMQFDNKHFESNVQTSMSTLDKLKQKLHLSGASKGLDDVNAAAKRVDMNGLAAGVETVRTRFSALEVMGVTALANITNSAVNAGKKMISALTIDPVKTGFNEYETQMNAVQTILANTKSKGSTLDDVNKALDTLNTYADKTIYNFTEMTRNIGTFTAAGVDLQTSVDSIQGIANLAAVSGSSSQQASTAMYQLSQALAAGRVSLMDWNSVVNAGMGGELFQNALIRTSELLKTGAKDAINTYGSFRESLTKGEWLTTEVLTETLKQLSGAYTEAELINQGFTKEQAKEITSLAETASDAATKVKTFSQLWEVMKESAQSGWAQTWKLIIGDFEQAKALLTPLAEFFTGDNGFITKISESRNKLLEGALGKSFSGLAKKINGVLDPVKNTAKAVENVTNTVKDYGKVVDQILGGEWGNGQARWDKLTKAGFDWAHAQNLVNEKLGDSTRHTTKYKEAQDGLNKSQEKTSETQQKVSGATAKTIEHLVALSDAELKAKGYTDEQIESLRELEKTADKLGMPMREFIANIDEINGRWLLINSFKNVGQSLVKIFTAIGDAWKDAFPPMQSDQLFNIIAGIHKFSTYLKMSDGTVEKLERTLKGVFAIFDILLTIVGGPIKIAFKILTQILAAFDLNILDATAVIGDAIVSFRDWIDETLDFTKVFEKVAPYVKSATNSIREWVNTTKPLQKFGDIFKNAVENFKIWIEELKESDNIPRDIIIGLANGLKNGVVTVWNAVIELGKGIIAKIKEVLGIHSPSKVFFGIGLAIVAGLILGLKNGAPGVWDAIMNFISPVVDFIKGIDFKAIFSGILSSGIVLTIYKLSSAFESLTAPLEGVGDVLSGTGKILDKAARPIKKILNNTAKVVKSFSKVMNSVAFNIKTEGIKNLATAMLMLVGAVIVLTFVDPEKLWDAVKIVGTLAAILVALAVMTEYMSKSSASIGKDGVQIDNFKSGLMGIAAAVLMMGITLKIIGSMKPEQALQGTAAIIVIMGAMVGLLAVYGKLVKGKSAQNMDKAGDMLRKLSITMLILAGVLKLLGTFDNTEVDNAFRGLIMIFGTIVALVYVMTKVGEKGKKVAAIGNTLIAIAGAMAILTVVAKMLAGMSFGDMGKAAIGLGGLVIVIALLVKIVKSAGDKVAAIGKTLLAISGAMAILTIVARIISGMSWGDMGKAAIGLGGLVVVIALLVKIVKSVEKDAPKIAVTLLALSGAIAILAAVVMVLGMLSIEHLAKGLIAITTLGLLMSAMILATKDAKDCKANLIAMTVAIGVMALAVAGLSFIDTAKLATATIAMSALMALFALIIKMAGNSQKAMGSLIVLTIALGVMAGAIYLVGQMRAENALASAASLSVLMGTLAGVLFIISKMSTMSLANAMIGVLGLLALCVPLYAIVGALAIMDGMQNATTNAIALGALMTVLAGVQLLCAAAGAIYAATGGIAILGLVGFAALVVLLYGIVGAIAIMGCIKEAETNTKLLINMLTVMTQMLVVLAIVGPLALVGVVAMAGLTALIVAIGALAVSIGWLMETFPSIQDFLNTGIPVLIQLAGGIGEMIGAFIGGIAEQLASSLPMIGMCLSQFIVNAMPFINGVKMVDSSVLEGVGIMAAAVIALTAADLIAGISSFIQGGSSFADLGTQLSQFMINALPFVAAASMLTPEMTEGVRNLAQTILILTAADVLNGLTSWFTGGSSLSSFGEEIAAFGPSIRTFADSVAGIDNQAVVSAANAAKTLAEMTSTIPNEGGVVGWFAGENSISKFAGEIVGLGAGLKGFSDAVQGINTENIRAAAEAGKALTEMTSTIPNEGGVTSWFAGENSIAKFASEIIALGVGLKGFSDSVEGINPENVKSASEAGKALTEMTSTIPNEGGMVAWFTGDNSLSKFSTEIVSLGKGLKGFSDSVEGINPENITSAANAAKSIAQMASIIPNEGGMVAWFTGDNSVSKFADKLPSLGKGLKGFSDSVQGVVPENITSAANAAKSLAQMADATPKNTDKIVGFGDNLSAFGSKLKAYFNATSGISADSIQNASNAVKSVKDFSSSINPDKVSSASKAIDGMVDAINKLSKVKNNVADNFSNAIKKLAETNINVLVKSFKKSEPDMKNAGQNIVKKFVEGVNSQKNSVDKSAKDTMTKFVNAINDKQTSAKNACTKLVSSCADAIKTKKSSFESAGKDLGSGLVVGINAKQQAVYKAGYALGQKAVQGEKDGQASKSPSKLTIKAGKWLGEGLIIGMRKMANLVYKSGNDLGATATNTISSAVSRISDYVNGDIDAQPTIRPVLDLSDVKSGANTIYSMLNGRTLAVDTQIARSISASMIGYRNGQDSREIVSAIKSLRKDFADNPRNSYTINGITYDDGSNVSSAVETLVRAARVERRV